MEKKDFANLIGKIAVTDTPLNPSGMALIDDEIYEVTAEDEFVDEGRGVKVIRIRGNKIIVKRV